MIMNRNNSLQWQKETSENLSNSARDRAFE